ncbi:MAG: antitoxin [Oscillospiraceae bacterium]|jgi:predicted HicB family RNase H-like nuclease|nr:antitoxin [Oscillospiraceae bacterium]
MGKTSAAVKNKYAAKVYDRLQIIVKKGKKAEIQAAAEKQGESLNAYVTEAVRRRMESELN